MPNYQNSLDIPSRLNQNPDISINVPDILALRIDIRHGFSIVHSTNQKMVILLFIKNVHVKSIVPRGMKVLHSRSISIQKCHNTIQ